MSTPDFNQKLANWENGLLNRYLDSCEGDDRCEDCECADPNHPETEEPADVNGQGYSECSCKCHVSYEPDPHDAYIDDQMDAEYYGPNREDY